jgi:hypothetical protein
LTKNGLVSVFVISPTTGWSAARVALAHHSAEAATHTDTTLLATGRLREFRFMGRSSNDDDRNDVMDCLAVNRTESFARLAICCDIAATAKPNCLNHFG